jgi:uncharacterized membrane protein YeaQ/YmgE (transglycosylase-associated protein family)
MRLDDRWRYALLGGLASVPFTVLVYLTAADGVSPVPIFLGGALAGYLYEGDRAGTRSVGLRAGVVGSLPAGWVLFELLGITPALEGPVWFRVTAFAVALLYVTVFLALVAGLGALVGLLGARTGDWVARKTGQGQPPTVGSE